MSFQTIWDRVGQLSAEVDGIKAAYTPLASGTYADVQDYLRNIPDGPVAWVVHDDTPVIRGGQAVARHHHAFIVQVYFPFTDPTVWKVAAPFPELFLAKWAERAKLYGEAQSNLITGWSFDAGEGAGVLIDEAPFLVLLIRVEVIENQTLSLAPN